MSVLIHQDSRRSAAGTSTREAEHWQDDAVCADPAVTAGRDPFYAPAHVGDERYDWGPARALCAACPVIATCLATALAEDTPGTTEGFRGGKTAPERRALRASVLRRESRARSRR
jgi:hypothetical protein